MADIPVACPACGVAQTVSEFATAQTFPCLNCGRPIARPQREPARSRLTLKKSPPPIKSAPDADGLGPKPDRQADGPRRGYVGAGRPSLASLKGRLAFLLFLVLTAGLTAIRFGGGWPGLPVETLQTWGRLAVAAAYLFIIGLALRDNMFDGLLSIVIPLYPFYYLYVTSGAVLTRAVVGALLAASGYDTLIFLQAWATRLGGAIHHWIQTV